MSTMEKRTSTRSSAGKKEAGRGQSPSSFRLKDKCRQLTVGEYIELVCYDNLEVMVVEGKPTSEALKEALSTVLQEYSKLVGAGESAAGMMYKNIVVLRGDILAASTALSVLDGHFDDEIAERVRKVLSKCGISTSTWGTQITAANIKRAAAELKAKQYRLAREIEHYNKVASISDGKKVTEADIRREMVAVGGDGIIPDDCNLATYAAKIKAHREMIKAIERQKLTKKPH